MARAERILSDEGIQTELDIYNPLVPGDGVLAATLFIELTSDAQLREWLPKLVGIERSVELQVGRDASVVRGQVDADHDKQLTRDEMTASVHYAHFRLSPHQAAVLAEGPVAVVVTHPEYDHRAELSAETRAELATDVAAVAEGTG